MTPTLAHPRIHRADGRARDWAEIQERMLVPLYEAVYERLGVGTATRLLGVGCGSGLALLMAAARGATVTGCDPDDQRLALARQRLLPAPQWGIPAPSRGRTRLVPGGPEAAAAATNDAPLFTVITAFDPAAPPSALVPALRAASGLAERGSPVVLAGWGPPERCATGRVLRVAARLAEPRGAAVETRLSGRDDLEDMARGAGLRPDGSGRVSCPFGYPDMDSAVRGLVSTGLFDAAAAATDVDQVRKELREALHPYRRADGTVRMENVFRYLVARV
ncbi:methyltransferase domain-containing protein [Streptomyces sp. MI02-7b]|uniref:methyltransferase domain-containing protein n=1 Tax=Streptomyces sp. MI02-7b TaxID=462941 RepID=UPI0029BB6822|nr:methyltransferase domain-containing protein [Streptomyces sp. MI02-7b]MDX3073005.1 SAM-dependent methyltransferase [Streptomyces sp. MI02-7b]